MTRMLRGRSGALRLQKRGLSSNSCFVPQETPALADGIVIETDLAVLLGDDTSSGRGRLEATSVSKTHPLSVMGRAVGRDCL